MHDELDKGNSISVVDANGDNRFQRVGAVSNTHVGRDFQRSAQNFLSQHGLVLEPEFAVAVGHDVKKLHRFDLGSSDPSVLVECKTYTWTTGGNTPSAKIRGLNEAMLLFSVAPKEYRKLLVMLRHLRREESLATNSLRNHGHLVPSGVEIWELDPNTGLGTCLLDAAPSYDGGSNQI